MARVLLSVVFGLSIALLGRQANVKEINTTKAMWDQKQMLVQHGDMSGTWTAEQRKMIDAMGMKSE
jgi:hypothetical protein